MTNEETDCIDAVDYQILLTAVLKQAMDDYIKLQHPKHRKKKYLQEEYLNAIDMFFDSSYRLGYFINDDDDEMTTVELIGEITGEANFDIKELQNHLVQQACTYWDEKSMKIITIPDTLQLLGHVYRVEHRENEEHFKLDLDNKVVFLDKKSTLPVTQKIFFLAVLQLIAHHQDIRVSRSNLEAIASGLFSVLKVNDCFLTHVEARSLDNV